MKRLLALLILLLPLSAQAADFTAGVVGISDGDTLTVLTAEKKQVKIQLWGIGDSRPVRTSARGQSRLPSSWYSART